MVTVPFPNFKSRNLFAKAHWGSPQYAMIAPCSADTLR
jgi:hypothetical protein